ncbi:MAG: hypothetical protein JXA91_02215 [Candidatus Thermoplasmatota archaeon]|nr:hypothetical protein [Candidatus Thermoplasmatota archaeon]
MKNYSVKKMMLAIIPFIMLTQAIIIPVMSTPENTENNTTLKIKIWDTVKGQVTEHEITPEIMKTFISLVTEEKLVNSFGDAVKNKLEILENIGLVESSTKNHINRLLNKIPNFENGQRFLPRSRALFDLFNFFNGVLVGLKGQKDNSFLDLPVYQFPFINSTITALFSVFGQYSGEGFIFTLGTLGFKYIYDFNMTKYGFPPFPNIKGSLIGFTGVILEAEVGDQLGEQYEGSYVIAAGMSILTVWNNA